MPDPTRRLAAIMFTDTVGYTKLMGENEQKALRILRKNRQLHKSIIRKHHGKWLKEMGDGTLASFKTTSDAVYCAGELMKNCKMAGITLRIGMHQGEIVEEDGDVFGDGVNVASRIEPLAEPGQILVSGPIHRNVKNKDGITTTFLKETELKNVDEPVRIFTLDVDVNQITNHVFQAPLKNRKKYLGITVGLVLLSLIIFLAYRYLPVKSSEKKEVIENSIAVLPFSNRSNREEDLPFTEGIQDEIRSRLAKISSLRVLPRSSVQAHKIPNKGSQDIGKELDVSYLLEGSVQRANDYVRIIVGLIDTHSNRQVWSESYDVNLAPVNILDIQTEIAKKTASLLGAVISEVEMDRIARRSTENYQAYDYYLRAFKLSNLMVEASRENSEVARKFYQEAIALDANYALAHAMLSDIHSWYILRGWDRSEQRKIAAKTEAEKAIKLAPDLSEAHYAMAAYYYRVEKDYIKALESLRLAEHGLRGEGFVQLLKGYIHRRAGQYEQAINALQLASNLDPRSDVPHMQIGLAYLWLHRYEEAERSFETALDLSHPDRFTRNQFRLESVDLYKNGSTYRLRQFLSNQDDNSFIYDKWFVEFIDNEYENALSVLGDSSNLFAENHQTYIIPKSLCRGWTYTAINEPNLAEKAYQDAIQDLTDLQSRIGEDFRILRSLGLAYAGLKKNKQAVEYGKKALESMPVEKDAVWGMFNVEALAIIYIQLGAFDLAVKEVQRLINSPSRIPIMTINKDPRYDPIRNHPKFIAAVNSLQ